MLRFDEMPRGPGVPSAGALRRIRPAIIPELRAAFQATVAGMKAQERAAYGLFHGMACETRVEAEIKRTAVRRAIVARGILKIWRRCIPLPEKTLKRAEDFVKTILSGGFNPPMLRQ